MKNLILLEGRESSNELDFGRPDFPSVEAFTITEKEIFLILKDKTLWNFKPNISKVELIADLKVLKVKRLIFFFFHLTIQLN